MVADAATTQAAEHLPVVGYETLCRRHFMRRVTAHGAKLMAQQDELLPFEVDACLWRGSGGPGEPRGT
jgi:thymidine kinase